MSELSNNRGRAYEYSTVTVLAEEIGKIRPVEIEYNSAYDAARRAWDAMPDNFQHILLESAYAAVSAIFDMEPLITEADGNDIVRLKIQTDDEGKRGDVRDILIIRRDIKWEIGLSLKHNHFAVKHSRLARTLDFGKTWFGVPCSEQYWADIKSVFDELAIMKEQGKKWREIEGKDRRIYIPLLRAFINEIRRSNTFYKELPQKMVEYLLGEFDFYKVISIDGRRITRVQTYNLHGTLNLPSRKIKPKIFVPLASLPTRIVELDFKPGSSNTVEMYMDGGWQFGFRIHNASTMVETSLKFDIQLIGMPVSIITIDCKWI